MFLALLSAFLVGSLTGIRPPTNSWQNSLKGRQMREKPVSSTGYQRGAPPFWVFYLSRFFLFSLHTVNLIFRFALLGKFAFFLTYLRYRALPTFQGCVRPLTKINEVGGQSLETPTDENPHDSQIDVHQPQQVAICYRRLIGPTTNPQFVKICT